MTEQCFDTFASEVTLVAGWFVTVGHPLVQKRFYAALDSTGSLCWTDEPALAEQFPMEQDAARFAELTCPDEDWAVTR